MIASFSSYPWGWLSDRIGGKAVMLIGQTGAVVVSLAWMVMPRQHAWWTHGLAAFVYFMFGVMGVAYALGDQRMFYGSVLPKERNMNHTMVFYTWCQVLLGSGMLLSGRLLDTFKNLHGTIGSVHLDQFVPSFGLGALLAGLGAWILCFVRADAPTLGVKQQRVAA